MIDLSKVRVDGPLEPFAAGFAAELTRLGYTPGSARCQLELAAHLGRFLAARGVDAMALTGPMVEAFLDSRRAMGYRAFRSRKALVPLLTYLRGLGAVPVAEVAVPAPSEAVLERYRGYLIVERGVGVKTARGYLDLVRPFVASCACGDGADVQNLTAGDVTSFLVSESHRLAPKTVQRLATALRSLLRFWHLDGVLEGSLVDVVPKVAYRSPGLPQALGPTGVAALLSSCDRDGPNGLRNFAILTLLARMGVRPGEVAGLRLDDIDWRRGEITVRGKGNRCDQLPLPADVGQTIVDYLRFGRPSDALDRCVFIRIRAPHHGMTTGGITQVVAAAARRAGLGTFYANRLRHTAATSMLTAGAPLAEIGQVLRHRRPLTTAIYAKVDTESLRVLARPWPVSVS
jgi:site-specific recombinase XerD